MQIAEKEDGSGRRKNRSGGGNVFHEISRDAFEKLAYGTTASDGSTAYTITTTTASTATTSGQPGGGGCILKITGRGVDTMLARGAGSLPPELCTRLVVTCTSNNSNGKGSRGDGSDSSSNGGGGGIGDGSGGRVGADVRLVLLDDMGGDDDLVKHDECKAQGDEEGGEKGGDGGPSKGGSGGDGAIVVKTSQLQVQPTQQPPQENGTAVSSPPPLLPPPPSPLPRALVQRITDRIHDQTLLPRAQRVRMLLQQVLTPTGVPNQSWSKR